MHFPILIISLAPLVFFFEGKLHNSSIVSGNYKKSNFKCLTIKYKLNNLLKKFLRTSSLKKTEKSEN